MDDIESVSLIDLLPESIRKDKNVLAAAQALDSELKAVTTAIQDTLIVPRIDDLPESIVDVLAWQFHVDFYEPGLTLEKKRSLVKKSIDWHKRKGTPSIVEEMVSSVFSGGKVYEWWEYGGQPYHFRVEATDIIQDGTVFDKLARLISAVKNVRSWLDSIRVLREKQSVFYWAGARQIGTTMTVKPAKLYLPTISNQLKFGTASRQAIYITIKPEVG